METTEQILERQYAELKFRNGRVEYFSISTQWDMADTIEDAIKNILKADEKYDGKAPLTYHSLKPAYAPPDSYLVFPDDIQEKMREAEKVLMSSLLIL